METGSYRVEPANEGDRAVGIVPLSPQAAVVPVELPKGTGVFGVTQIVIPTNAAVVTPDQLASQRPSMIEVPALIIHAEMRDDAETETRYFAIVPAGAKAPPLWATYLGCVPLGGRVIVAVFEFPLTMFATAPVDDLASASPVAPAV